MQEKEETPILGIIKQIYKIADFEPTLAKKYTEQIIPLEKELHLDYMVKCFQCLRTLYIYIYIYIARWVERLDSGKPWLLFWVTAVVNLISSTENILKLSEQREVIKFINCCQSPEGGFGGSEGYLPQIASTYAAVCCLVNLGSKEALEVINVKGMKNFLIKMKYNGEERAGNKITDIKTNVRGSFEIHENGENDLRAIYCALIVGDILGLNEEPEIREGIAEYIEECQTYEGGLACIPFGEAHGGYTYCGLCSLHLLGEKEVFNLDLPRLLEWWVNRQIEGQGGFNGRINKLVDSCYNFWQGALSEVLDIILKGAANYQGQWYYIYIILYIYIYIW